MQRNKIFFILWHAPLILYQQEVSEASKVMGNLFAFCRASADKQTGKKSLKMGMEFNRTKPVVHAKQC